MGNPINIPLWVRFLMILVSHFPPSQKDRERKRERERERAKVFTLLKPTLWSAKIMVQVIEWKILGVQDLQTIQTYSSS